MQVFVLHSWIKQSSPDKINLLEQIVNIKILNKQDLIHCAFSVLHKMMHAGLNI